VSPVKGISFREYSFIEISAVFRYMFPKLYFVLNLLALKYLLV
jgi:hypothetical protein